MPPHQVVTRGAVIVAAQTAHVALEDKMSGTVTMVAVMSIYLHLGRHRQLEETDSVPQESRSWGGQSEWMWRCCEVVLMEVVMVGGRGGNVGGEVRWK